MNTISSEYIKEIKAQIRIINESLKRVQEAEKVQETTVNAREYEKAKNEAIDASLEVWQHLSSLLHQRQIWVAVQVHTILKNFTR